MIYCNNIPIVGVPMSYRKLISTKGTYVTTSVSEDIYTLVGLGRWGREGGVNKC